MVGNLISRFYRESLDVGKELICYSDQSVSGPSVEPINGGAVNETRELSSTESECVADGREAQSHVQILPHLVDEELKESVRGVEHSLRFGLRTDLSKNCVDFIGSEELGNVTCGKNIVDVDQELVIYNL